VFVSGIEILFGILNIWETNALKGSKNLNRRQNEFILASQGGTYVNNKQNGKQMSS
jgi:hypothetical protein